MSKKVVEQEATEQSLSQVEIERIDSSIKILNEENSKFEPYIKLKDNDDFKKFIDSYTIAERDRIAGALTNDSHYEKNTIDLMRTMLSGIKSFNRFLSVSASNYVDNEEVMANLRARKKGILDGSIQLMEGE